MSFCLAWFQDPLEEKEADCSTNYLLYSKTFMKHFTRSQLDIFVQKSLIIIFSSNPSIPVNILVELSNFHRLHLCCWEGKECLVYVDNNCATGHFLFGPVIFIYFFVKCRIFLQFTVWDYSAAAKDWLMSNLLHIFIKGFQRWC